MMSESSLVTSANNLAKLESKMVMSESTMETSVNMMDLLENKLKMKL